MFVSVCNALTNSDSLRDIFLIRKLISELARSSAHLNLSEHTGVFQNRCLRCKRDDLLCRILKCACTSAVIWMHMCIQNRVNLFSRLLLNQISQALSATQSIKRIDQDHSSISLNENRIAMSHSEHMPDAFCHLSHCLLVLPLRKFFQSFFAVLY